MKSQAEDNDCDNAGAYVRGMKTRERWRLLGGLVAVILGSVLVFRNYFGGEEKAPPVEYAIDATSRDSTPERPCMTFREPDPIHGSFDQAFVDAERTLLSKGYSIDVKSLSALVLSKVEIGLARASALYVLRGCPYEQTEGTFLRLLDDPDFEVQSLAARHLERHGNPKGIEILRSLVPFMEDPLDRGSAALRLFLRGEYEMYKEVEALLVSSDEKSRKIGAQMLSALMPWRGCPQLGNFDPLEAAIEAARDESQEVRRSALITLGGTIKYHIFDESNLRQIEAIATDDPVEGNRKRALRIVERGRREVGDPVFPRCKELDRESSPAESSALNTS